MKDSFLYKRDNENGFVTLTVLVVALLCMTMAGYVIANARTKVAHTLQTEQILHVDLLSQDALEIAKHILVADPKWRGTSSEIVRNGGTSQYIIQDKPELPLSDSIQIAYPLGVMITGIGKGTDGSLSKQVIWYDPGSGKIYAYMQA